MTTAMQFTIEILHNDQWSDDANLLGHGCSDADNTWATESEALAVCDELAAIGGFDRSRLRVVPLISMADPTIATDWTFDPMPAVDGWFAVIKCWDSVEEMFADVVYANHGIVPWPDNSGMCLRGEGHAGPFATQEEAIAWADAHDPE